MKTNQNMIRLITDQMGGLEVVQRTKDSMFNATVLANQWKNIDKEKRPDRFLRLVNTKEFIVALLEEMGHHNWDVAMKLTDSQLVLNRQDSATLDIDKLPTDIINITRGKYGGTWMHPFLFIKFAMWLNPRFEVQVIKFIYDKLIVNRHGAGDSYRTLSGAVSKFDDVDYKKVAKGLNFIVFGKHEHGLRQVATEEQLKELVDLEQNLTFAVEMGFITSFDHFLGEMRKLYKYKYPERY